MGCFEGMTTGSSRHIYHIGILGCHWTSCNRCGHDAFAMRTNSNKPAAGNRGTASRLTIEHHWRGAAALIRRCARIECLFEQLRKGVLLIMMFVAAAVVVTGCSRAEHSEPRFGGRTLSEWLTDYEAGVQTGGTRNTNALVAIRSIGSNAVPFLVKWINVDYTAPERLADFIGFAAGHPYQPPRIKRGNKAMRGFEILGTNAVSAIPGLTKIILEDKRYDPAVSARYALVYIGAPGVSALGMLATNQSTPRRVETVLVLGTSCRSGLSEAAMPWLTNCLSDPDPQVRYAATNGLAEIARQNGYRARMR